LPENGSVHLAQALLQLTSHAVIWKLGAADRALLQQRVDLQQFGRRLLVRWARRSCCPALHWRAPPHHPSPPPPKDACSPAGAAARPPPLQVARPRSAAASAARLPAQPLGTAA
jgi:hypothetical protein